MKDKLWEKLEEYMSDPENHENCRCRQFTIGNTEKFQECAVDQCNCNAYENIENFLMWLEK